MLSVVDNNKLLSVVDGYYSMLEKTGYVKHDTVIKLLVYEFLAEFIQEAAFFITEEDYLKIDELLRMLFSNGGCIMSYPVFCTNRTKLAGFAADGYVRITEDKSGNEARITEDLSGNEVRVV